MTQTVLKCPNCEATTNKSGVAFKNHSALNAHINIHCPKKSKNESGHEHKFMLLNATKANYGPLVVDVHQVAQAMNQGYTKICECGEVVK